MHGPFVLPGLLVCRLRYHGRWSNKIYHNLSRGGMTSLSLDSRDIIKRDPQGLHLQIRYTKVYRIVEPEALVDTIPNGI